MRTLFTPLLLLLTIVSYAQTDRNYVKPDYDRIKADIANSSSVYYYPKLMERYVAGDSTLTNKDYRYLYYGYQFQPQYNPYGILKEADELQKYNREKQLSNEDREKAIELCKSAMKESPFDLKVLQFLTSLYMGKNDTKAATTAYKRLGGVLLAILSSGDGNSGGSAFHVITVSDEYILLSVLNITPVMQTYVDGCDVFDLSDGQKMYFDVSRFFGKGLDKDTK
jgi:hypothetical protein